jgi:Tfp pilus assembly protein PilZ
MQTNRIDKRYDVGLDGEIQNKSNATIEGESVLLVNFSASGVYAVSEQAFSVGKIVNITIYLKEQRKLTLLGKVVRVTSEGAKWGIAIEYLIF